jgi:hypothetical protein
VQYILSVGHDTALLETRRLLLESADFHIDSAEDVPSAVALCQRYGSPTEYRAVILCHTLEPQEKDALCAFLHDTGSHSRVIRLSEVEDVSYSPQAFVSLVLQAAQLRRAARRSA